MPPHTPLILRMNHAPSGRGLCGFLWPTEPGSRVMARTREDQFFGFIGGHGVTEHWIGEAATPRTWLVFEPVGDVHPAPLPVVFAHGAIVRFAGTYDDAQSFLAEHGCGHSAAECWRAHQASEERITRALAELKATGPHVPSPTCRVITISWYFVRSETAIGSV